VPAESGHHAIGGTRVLDLEHRALARLIRRRGRLRDHAVESGAFEALQPIDRDRAIARHRREVEGFANLLEELLELRAAVRLRLAQQTLPIHRQEIESDERGWHRLRELLDPGRRRMQPHLQTAEIETVGGGHHDLAVQDDAARQLLEQHGVELGEVTIERPQLSALDEDAIAVAKHDRAKAVPLGLEQEVAVLRNLLSELGEHGFDGWGQHAVKYAGDGCVSFVNLRAGARQPGDSG